MTLKPLDPLVRVEGEDGMSEGETGMNKTLARHLAAIQAGEVTGTNVRGLRIAINKAERARVGWPVPEYATPEWCDDVFRVEEALEDTHPKVTGDLHASGVEVLRNKRYAKRWTPNQAAVIAELDHFLLMGFERIGRRGQYATPVYRAVGYSGLGFNFRNVPWQSGGDGPEVWQF